MDLDFDPSRWEKIRQDSRRWWAGELERPLIQLRVPGRAPGRPEPSLPRRPRAAHYGFGVPAEQVIDRWDYELSRVYCVGDAFPWTTIDLGPCALSAFLGARLVPDENTCWYFPEEIRDIRDLHFRYDPDNPWLRRCKDLCRAAVERWDGRALVAMPSLSGALDNLSIFRPGEQLLLDLYDHPDEVKRLTWEIHEIWWRCFDEINAVLQPRNPGYTAWTQIYSAEPYFMLQCDFSYMISPAMFDEFVKPELA
ncbi:MAG: hypothetical protein NTW86_09905, partial [Candidatus Sumerlaeota bacterium]|nr:hypothetical protein [Candidatus Sumerlaeota bacterium]